MPEALHHYTFQPYSSYVRGKKEEPTTGNSHLLAAWYRKTRLRKGGPKGTARTRRLLRIGLKDVDPNFGKPCKYSHD